MTKFMTMNQTKFYYINSELFYVRSDEPLNVGFAYKFTEKNDNSRFIIVEYL